MAKYIIKKYYTRKHDKKHVKIWATVFKYRFGFLVDIIEEELDSEFKCSFENKLKPFYYRQKPRTKKESEQVLSILSNVKFINTVGSV